MPPGHRVHAAATAGTATLKDLPRPGGVHPPLLPGCRKPHHRSHDHPRAGPRKAQEWRRHRRARDYTGYDASQTGGRGEAGIYPMDDVIWVAITTMAPLLEIPSSTSLRPSRYPPAADTWQGPGRRQRTPKRLLSTGSGHWGSRHLPVFLRASARAALAAAGHRMPTAQILVEGVGKVEHALHVRHRRDVPGGDVLVEG